MTRRANELAVGSALVNTYISDGYEGIGDGVIESLTNGRLSHFVIE